ncbi:hypothetical protein ACJJIE_00015 (plasmid) [Microbulbifer sp. TRSA001]|uniref:hypothetical protein n=1 Tax=Microbulbifer sp. TRSA001 TaxID=3243381 RepID=UPI00403940C3
MENSIDTPAALLSQLTQEGGAIVRIDACSPMEIADAEKTGRICRDDKGGGFVLRPARWLRQASENAGYLSGDAQPQNLNFCVSGRFFSGSFDELCGQIEALIEQQDAPLLI